MENLEYIEGYFSEPPTELRKREFEDRVMKDPAFAEELAFYLSAKSVASEAADENRKERFRKVYSSSNLSRVPAKTPVRRIMPWLAAAAAVVAALFVGWVLFLKPQPPKDLATNYINRNFATLPVTMGTQRDSLQLGLKYYNEGHLTQALIQFESIVQNNQNAYAATKYAGIVSLRLGNYDKAITYFTRLEADTVLQVNPGKFLHALVLMKRGQSGDRDAAKLLLQQVIASNQYGATEAKRWLLNW